MQEDVESCESTAPPVVSLPFETMNCLVAEQAETIKVSGQSSRREPRSIDAFLDEAYEDKTKGIKWTYWIVMISLGLSNSSESAELISIGFLLSDPTFQTKMLQVNWHGSLLASSLYVGMLTGTLFVGALGDVIGRRPLVRVSLAMVAVLGILSSFSLNIYQLSLLRALTGIGIGSLGAPLMALSSELAPPSRRGLFVTIVSCSWLVGSIYVAVVAWIILAPQNGSWRWFLVAMAVPSIVTSLLVSLLVVESPRFQAIQQQQEEAVLSVQRLAKQMRYSGPPMTIDEMLHHYPKTTTNTFSVVSSDGTSAAYNQGSFGTSWPQMYKKCVRASVNFGRSTLKLYDRQLVRTTGLLQIVWIGLCFGSNGISLWITRLFQEVHMSNIYLDAVIFAVAQIPGFLLTVFLIDWTTRQRVLSIGFLSSAVSLIAFAYFASGATSSSSSTTTTLGVVTAACAFQACMQIAWNTVSVVTTERFPTVVRATAYAVLSASGKVSGAAANFVNGFLISWPVMLLLLTSAFMVMAGVAPFGLEEMHGNVLKDDLHTSESDKSLETGEGTPVASLSGDDHDDDTRDLISDENTSIMKRDYSYQSM